MIGGDAEADEKASRLCESGAVVTVLASGAGEPLTEARKAGAQIIERGYEPGDISDQFMVLLAIKTDPALSAAVADECRARRVLLAAIDQPDLSDVSQVALFETGHLQISVSTDGHAPALAKRIRKGMETSLAGEPVAEFVSYLADLRRRLEKEIPDLAERRKALIAAVAGFEFKATVQFPPGWKPR